MGWRGKRGFLRDKARHGGRFNTLKGLWKHFTWRKHRALERVELAAGRYDTLGHNSYKYVDDWWNWD